VVRPVTAGFALSLGFCHVAPIQEANGAVTEAAPLFYGMLLFTLAGNGNVLKTTTSAAGINLTAYAVAQPDGSTNVVLNNKDATSAVTATVDLGATVTAGAVIYLQGPMPVSLSATSGVTIASAGISPAGTWTPSAPYALTASGHTVSVVVPPASAALVHAH
jgi:hypothetical protein